MAIIRFNMGSSRLGTTVITTTLCSTAYGESLIYPSIKSRNNPGDIWLPWNCASVLKSNTHHLALHKPPIEQKPTITGLIINKHSTHPHTHTHTHAHNKLHYLVRGRSGGKLSNPWGNKRKSWTHLSSSFHLINTRSKKVKP